MGQELEVKYALPEEGALAAVISGPLLSPFLFAGGERVMDATYYDTEDFSLSAHRAALRLRKEEGRNVCCLKLAAPTGKAGLFFRREYETEADTIGAGLAALAAFGAPEEALSLLRQAALLPVCRIVFTRRIWLYRRDGLQAELAADIGCAAAGGKTAPIRELELELKSGPEEAFFALLSALEGAHPLVRLAESKLARALRLSRGADAGPFADG